MKIKELKAISSYFLSTLPKEIYLSLNHCFKCICHFLFCTQEFTNKHLAI